MKALVFSSRSYSESALKAENVSGRHQLKFLETNLNAATAPLCSGYDAALVFVNDKVDRTCLQILAQGGTKLVATLSTGTNHIDLTAAKDLGITIASVPSYSPHAVSEFTLAVLLAMAATIDNRKPDEDAAKAWAASRPHTRSARSSRSRWPLTLSTPISWKF